MFGLTKGDKFYQRKYQPMKEETGEISPKPGEEFSDQELYWHH